ncbi:short chain dehydrogenase reductase [Lasallia pustulata]|uniref:Short chain dehydrogenase reductase n=1 Tax=Lasallia pustulata TaxID=136370 RepID=A0A1W5DC56_9LECA|nr:short chain dehydrogenase reductase [Lasallia pustulata]
MATGAKSNEDLKSSKLFDVSNCTAVVTGGGTGIGLMITQALVSNGAKVYITGRREEALNSVVDQYNTGPGKILALPGDISKKDDVKRIADEVSSKESKGIHLLVNNAGIARDDNTKYSGGKPDFTSAQSISDHLWKSEPENWQETFQTNITAQFFTTAAFLPLLARGRGVTPGYTSSVVNIASISGVMKGSSSGQFAYATSKAGFIHLTRMMASTFAEAKIRVNCIAPGIFPSEMTAGSSGDDQKSSLDMEMSNPAGRTGHDSDMAACILFLAGPGGLFLNSQVLYPDGGNILVQPAAT